MKHLRKQRDRDLAQKRALAHRFIVLYERFVPLRDRAIRGTLTFDEAYNFVCKNLNAIDIFTLDDELIRLRFAS